MEFTDTRTRETHSADAFATITSAERMEDITTRWHGSNRYETVGVPFTPERARFVWTWAGALGWVLTQITVSGHAIKKDGSRSVKTRSVDFIRRGEVAPTTPSALIELAEELAPKSEVRQP